MQSVVLHGPYCSFWWMGTHKEIEGKTFDSDLAQLSLPNRETPIWLNECEILCVKNISEVPVLPLQTTCISSFSEGEIGLSSVI